MYTSLFFDLDGTLTDSREGIFNSIRHALASFDRQASDAELLPFIGPPLMDSFQRVCKLNPLDAQSAVKKYREYYRAKGIFENRLYPDIEVLLSALQAAGKRIFLATSKPEIFARQILEYFSIDRYFAFIGGAEMQGPRQNKIDVLRYALRHDDAPNSRCVMIGDREYDMLAAQTADISSIGVLWGYGSCEELQQSGARRMAKSAQELQKLLLEQSLEL